MQFDLKLAEHTKDNKIANENSDRFHQISDKNNKYVRILAIKEVEKLKDMIRNEVEKRRKATGTKEVDFE